MNKVVYKLKDQFIKEINKSINELKNLLIKQSIK